MRSEILISIIRLERLKELINSFKEGVLFIGTIVDDTY